jgi:sugar phosphate isomerase/epimerase
VLVAASTSSFGDLSLEEVCHQISELEFDKVELSFDEHGGSLRTAEIAANPDRFYTQFREATRLTPVAINLRGDVRPEVFAGISKLAKLMRVTQITIAASPVGTPFNTEIDRLREFLKTANRDAIRLSVKTERGCLTENPHTAVELCQAARGLGITLDPSYYICTGQGPVAYDQVFGFVYHVHLRDTSPRQIQVPIGLGQIDYSRLVSQLRRQNYSRVLSVELLPSLIQDAERPLEMRKLRMLLETLL